MDPQQRLLLETAAEALLVHPEAVADEALRAGWGVFVGVSSNDYARVAARHLGGSVTAYSATGTALSVTSGRLSYTLRLKGPAVTVETGVCAARSGCTPCPTLPTQPRVPRASSCPDASPQPARPLWSACTWHPTR